MPVETVLGRRQLKCADCSGFLLKNLPFKIIETLVQPPHDWDLFNKILHIRTTNQFLIPIYHIEDNKINKEETFAVIYKGPNNIGNLVADVDCPNNDEDEQRHVRAEVHKILMVLRLNNDGVILMDLVNFQKIRQFSEFLFYFVKIKNTCDYILPIVPCNILK